MQIDADFMSVLVCAVRYCLGRRTYMPSLVTGWIMKNCKLDEKTIKIMLEDIDSQQARFGLGDPCDYATWTNFESWLMLQRGDNDDPHD